MTKIFAHRGYSAKFPENTMIAFQEAERTGADGIELDVQLSKDGEVVVIHDEKVNRTTNGKGFVKDLTAAELKRLDASYHIKTNTKKEPIPTLKEVFDWMKTNNIICNIELKNGIFRYEGMEEKVIQMIRRYGLEKRIIISSFNHYSIVDCYRMAPDIETAPLLGQAVYMPWVYAQSIQGKGFHPKYSTLTDYVINMSLENNISVRPYTVNKEKDMEWLFRMNCTAFITDDPVHALRLRKMLS